MEDAREGLCSAAAGATYTWPSRGLSRERLWYVLQNARTHAYPALRAAQLGINGGEQVGKLFPSRSYRFTEALPSCLSILLHWQPAGLGWAGLGWAGLAGLG